MPRPKPKQIALDAEGGKEIGAPGDLALLAKDGLMGKATDPPRCKTCGAIEPRHICKGAITPKVRDPLPPKKPGKKRDRRAYQRERTAHKGVVLFDRVTTKPIDAR